MQKHCAALGRAIRQLDKIHQIILEMLTIMLGKLSQSVSQSGFNSVSVSRAFSQSNLEHVLSVVERVVHQYRCDGVSTHIL